MSTYQIDFKYVPNILKYFYDEELLDPDFLISWADSTSEWCDEPFRTSHFLWNSEINE